MRCHGFLPLALLVLTAPLIAQSNAVPFVNQPLVPSAVAPSSSGFTLTVNGTGFVPGSVVNWNAVQLSTTFVSSSRLRASVPASYIASSATVNVTVSNPAPGGGRSSPVLFSVRVPTPSLTFAPSILQVGTDPGALVAGDFNNDGKTDLAVYNLDQTDPCYPYYELGTLQILAGDGAGQFSTASNTCTGMVAGRVGLPFLVAEDFNGDGKLDVAAEAYDLGASSLSVFLGNGDGTLAESDWFYLNDSAQTITPSVADFNKDGHLDIAFTSVDGVFPGLFVFNGNGNGTFTCCVGATAVLGTGSYAGDFNRDGILDIAVLNYANAFTGAHEPVGINFGVGGGIFTVAPTQPFSMLMYPSSAVVADFNRDGILDMAFADSASTAVPVLLGKGDGTFAEADGEPALGCSANGGIAAADLNGDGKLDVVFTCPNSIEIFLGNGDGTFQPGLAEPVGNTPQSVAVGDFNGDGRLDLAVSNSADSTVTILLQTLGYKALVQPPVNASGNSVFNASRGVIPIKFTLTQNGTSTCALPPATISVARTAGGALGMINESAYQASADKGSNFRVDSNSCQYIYNLASLGVGTYQVNISISGVVVGDAVFALK